MQLPLRNQDQYEKGFLQFRTPYPAGFGSLTGQPHLGSDIITPTGTPLIAMFDGTVKFTTGKQGGNTATLTAPNPLNQIPCSEFEIRYMHLDRFGKDGQVKAGDVIGFTGNSGQASTAPHLHLDIRPSGTAVHIDNFYNPNTIFELIQKNMIPQWFKDNGTDKWAENKAIRIDRTNLTDSDCRELESLKKATQPADIEVTTIIAKELSREELRAYKLSLREVTKFFDGYVNLIFKEPEIRNLSLTLTDHSLNYTPATGLSVILHPDREVGKMKGDNVNGFMVVEQRTTVIARGILLREDSRHRSEYHYAATLAHEFMHWFATKLDFEVRQDRTHYFDYEYTLANYLPKLAFGLLHDKNFRANNGL